LTSCIGWLLDVYVYDNHTILSIKTEEGEILKLRDSYHSGFYILPRSEADGTHLFQMTNNW